MVVSSKDKKDKSKKQTQSKESKALRLIKERKRKAQLRTNPALSIYESGRERTKRVVKKEYPLVNINKLPAILTKGNDDIGVVWKNTNKIQSHTLFSASNLPCREPASKDDVYYYIAPHREPKSVNIIEEFKKYKMRFAKENQNRYTDLKLKINKAKIPSSIPVNKSFFNESKANLKSKVPSSFLNDNDIIHNKENSNEFTDAMSNAYEESLKNNFLPLVSTFSTNPLTKGRLLTEMGLDNKSSKNNMSLHKIKKKINKNKAVNPKTKLNKINDGFIMNKDFINHDIGSIMDAIQPLDSILSAKPVNVNNSLISNQNKTIPTLDFINDPLDLNKVKMEEDNLIGNLNNFDSLHKENDLLMDLLNIEEDPKIENDLLDNSLILPPYIEPKNDLDFISSQRMIAPLPKRQRSGTLDEILAPFKVPLSPKVKNEESGINTNGFGTFNCFNFDDMDLPKIELPPELRTLNQKNVSSFQYKDSNTLFDAGLKEKFDSPTFGFGNLGMTNDLLSLSFKKEFPSPPHEKINELSTAGLDEISRFGSSIPKNKLKSVKMETDAVNFDGFDFSKVKHEYDNNLLTPTTINNCNDDVLMDVNPTLLNDIIIDNESLMSLDSTLVPSIQNNNLLSNSNMAIDCFNTELTFENSPFNTPNNLGYINSILGNNIINTPQSHLNKCLLPSPEEKTMKDFPNTISNINGKAKSTISDCCSNSVPLATTTSANLRTIPDWYNQDGISLSDPNTYQEQSSPQLIKPLVPALDTVNTEKMIDSNIMKQSVNDISNEILNDSTQYTSFLDTEIPLPFSETNIKTTNEDKSKCNNQGSCSSSNLQENKNEELSEKLVDEIIDRLSKDDKLRDATSSTCFNGQNIQETGKMLKKMSKELERLGSNSEQLENSEKKWEEWRKEILAYENEAHQWLNARIEFYSRRVIEYRKDWIEYWIKRYLMQQKQQIKTLSHYINIPQNLQFASNLLESESNANTSAAKVSTTNASIIAENKKNPVKSVGRETIEQFKRNNTSCLVALTADVKKDPRLEVIGKTVDVSNKELLNSPKLIKEYHEKLLVEKQLLLEKYDVVNSLDLIPSDRIQLINNTGDNDLVNINNSNGSKGYPGSSKGHEEIASVLIDEYVKEPYESKRIFIHGIPKDYQLMFNDKMKSLIFILDKCIQDKKDLYETMEENRKKYFIHNES